jgi:PhnB protein
MPDAYLSPYLNFDGNAREAMEFYHKALGGKLEIHPFSEYDMPGTPKELENKVMHAMIANDSLSFMASDRMPGPGYNQGNNFSMSIAGTDADRLRKFWESLSEGGEITMPMAKQVWGDEFGMFTDKFGVGWMINITAQPS